MHLGVRLKHIRETQKVTQEELARRAGLPKTAISKIENGVQRMRVEEAMAIAAALGVSLYVLVGLEEFNPCSMHYKLQQTARQAVRQLRSVADGIDAMLDTG